MTADNFVYWLKGYFEMTASSLPGIQVGFNIKQMELMKQKLDSVYGETKPYYPPVPERSAWESEITK